MNKEEILKREAGEELDRLVAEFMEEPMPEFTPENALDLQLAGSPVKSPKGNWLCLCSYSACRWSLSWQPLPYSTDISAAWLVVEKMRDELFSVRLRFLIFLQEQTYHVVQGTGEKIYTAWPDVFWSITPEAICKATLLAKKRLEEGEC